MPNEVTTPPNDPAMPPIVPMAKPMEIDRADWDGLIRRMGQLELRNRDLEGRLSDVERKIAADQPLTA